MHFDINLWLKNLENNLDAAFGKRLLFFGLQGSYGRGEQTPSSDIDIVVILDECSLADLVEYRNILTEMEKNELACGFISGKRELEAWEKFDLLQLYLDTKPIKGSLDYLREFFSDSDIKRAVHVAACNLYHACVHNFIHERSFDILRELYKNARFLVRLNYLYKNGEYISSMKDLAENVDGLELRILEMCNQSFSDISENDFNERSDILIRYSSEVITLLN